ncbi:MAG: hypothetical protein H3C30_10565, partial [Candidatus Hydrogenedentes bacterium]|nr:hypothetical protein [Candidatus Hydrogenedentota bacterium]
MSFCAYALTGSGDSSTGPLETVRPRLLSVTVLTERSLSVTFSERLLAPGAHTPGNYTLSGPGLGTLGTHPATVTGTNPYTLSWATGEMRGGRRATLAMSGLQDMKGNPLDASQGGASAQGTAMGMPPVFSNIAASPPQASVGDRVLITFSVSEPLSAPPLVTVNGHAALWVSGKSMDYAYEYLVREDDPPGAAAIYISGADLAGNEGSQAGLYTLFINDNGQNPTPSFVPMRPWPLALVLLLTGIVVVARRRRFPVEDGAKLRGFLLLALALALGASAFAQGPVVSNVTFTQGPDGASNTKVDIYYDLSAPNGPCAVTVSLSKDGGADGYVHQITSVSGDVADVASGTGKHIVWDIAADYPGETIPEASIRVTADDGITQHTLTYTAGANGSITGTTPQTVNHGADGTEVTATPDTGYHFVQWSDGVLTAARTDLNVTA